MGNRTRKIAEILGKANHSTGKLNSTNLDVNFTDTTFNGTEGIKIPVGNTAQRGSTTGQWRYNSQTGYFEGYNGTSFSQLAPAPTISSIDTTEIDSASGSTTDIVLTGTNFSSSDTISLIANDGTSVTPNTYTHTNASSKTINVTDSDFSNAKEPYDVKITGPGGTYTLEDQINVDSAPAWDTASGSLGTVYEDTAMASAFTVSATDPDGDTVSYSETGGTVIASTLGLTLNSSTGAISGTPNAGGSYASGGVTHNFTLRATAGGKTTDRAFSILRKWNDGSTEAQAVSSAKYLYDTFSITTNGYYWLDLDGTPRQFYCDMTNGGYILFGHWSPDTSNAGSATVGSTSYAANTGGYTGATATAVAQPDTSDNITTASKWVWASNTRGTNTGGSWYRNEASTSGGRKSYMPNNYGYSWTDAKIGLRISIPGGTNAYTTPDQDNYNSVDGFTGAGGIDTNYVDGVSITTGGVSSRNHIWTYAAYDNASATGGGAGQSAPAHVGSDYTYIQSHAGSSTSSYQDVNNSFSISSTTTPPEICIISDQETGNEDNYIRGFYVFLK